jgi:oligoendopeptidase F
MTVQLPRAALYEAGPWQLGELLPDADEATVLARLAEIEAQVAGFELLRESLVPEIEPADLAAMVDRYADLVESVYVLSGYAALRFSADTRSEEALSLRSRLRDALAGLANRTLFFVLWWKELEDEAAARLLDALAGSADSHHFLSELRRLRRFSLDESSEQAINLKNANGIDALVALYSMLTSRLEFRLTVEGEEKVLTRDEIQGYFYASEPEVREEAYRELFRVFDGEAKVLGQIYTHRVLDWHNEHLMMRGYPSPISVRNRANDVPDAAVDLLIEAARESAGLFRRYFRLKAGWVGCDRLRRYDLYAPLAASERTVPYGDAVAKVLDTLGGFHPRVAELAERVFAEEHVDGEIRSGKKSGAFCATILPRQTPWLLLNYTGRVRAVATLAHELGHAVHSLLAADHSVLTQAPSLPLAETASVFAEMLLTDRLLEEESDPLARRELLASSMDDIYATVMRQAYFTRFEIAAHQAVREGRPPSALDELYLETLHEQFGDSVELSDDFRREWIAIPHLFLTPFYCYSYSFGQLLVLSLYQRFREQGEAFIPGYLRLLAYGGSARPERILGEVGVNIGDTDFWRGGFRIVERMIDELESLGAAGI